MKKSIIVNGSPVGENIATNTNNEKKACRRYLLKNSRCKMPSCDKNQATIGNSNTSPMKKQTIKKVLIYESNETLCSINLLSSYPAKNRKVSGKRKKYPTATPQ